MKPDLIKYKIGGCVEIKIYRKIQCDWLIYTINIEKYNDWLEEKRKEKKEFRKRVNEYSWKKKVKKLYRV